MKIRKLLAQVGLVFLACMLSIASVSNAEETTPLEEMALAASPDLVRTFPRL